MTSEIGAVWRRNLTSKIGELTREADVWRGEKIAEGGGHMKLKEKPSLCAWHLVKLIKPLVAVSDRGAG